MYGLDGQNKFLVSEPSAAVDGMRPTRKEWILLNTSSLIQHINAPTRIFRTVLDRFDCGADNS